MGKKTLYHPVSLHVIRGALEFCGFKPGRLHQTSSDTGAQTATYQIEIKEFPRDMPLLQIQKIATAINNCFSDDITVSRVTCDYDVKKRTVKWCVFLFVDIHEITPIEAFLEEKSL